MYATLSTILFSKIFSKKFLSLLTTMGITFIVHLRVSEGDEEMKTPCTHYMGICDRLVCPRDAEKMTQEMPAMTMTQMVREDSDNVYKHLPRYRCKGCGDIVVNDVWCNACLTKFAEEADNQPPIFVGEWED